MIIDDCVDMLANETAGYILLALDEAGATVSRASEVPLTLSMVSAQSKTEVDPMDLLQTIRVIESLVGKEKKPAKGKRQSTGRKPSSAGQPTKTDPATTT
jgi:hypothetical protein